MSSRVFGPYRLAGELSRGPSATVYQAHDTSHHDRVVALKVFTPALSADPAFRERFRRDAGLLSVLREPHVVPIHRSGEIDGLLFLDMRLVRGPSLAEVLRAGPLEPARAAAIRQQIAAAAESLRRGGIGDRPLRQSDVLLTGTPGRTEFVQLVGLGLGRPPTPGPQPDLMAPPPRSRTRTRALVVAAAVVAVLAVVLTTLAVTRGRGADPWRPEGPVGLVAVIPAPLETVAAVEVAGPDHVLVATADGTVHAWRLDPAREAWPPVEGAGVVTTAELDGGVVAVVAQPDSTLVVHDLGTGAPVGSPLGTPRSVEASPWVVAGGVESTELDGVPVAVAAQPTGARVTDSLGNEVDQLAPQALPLRGGAPAGPALGEEGQVVGRFALVEVDGRPAAVSIVGEKALQVRDLATGARVGVPVPPQATGFTALATAVRAGAPVAVTGGLDNTVRIWDLRTGEQIGAPLVGHVDQVAAVAVVRHGDRAVVVSRAGALMGGARSEVRFWDLETGAPLGAPLVDHPLAEGFVAASDASADDARLVATAPGEPITLWAADQLIEEVTR